MTSGNPARAAQQATIAEVRAAAKAGKEMVVRPWPGSEVRITTTNPDHAEAIVMALQPQEDLKGRGEAVAILHTLNGYLDLCFDAAPRQTSKWIVARYKYYIEEKGLGDNWEDLDRFYEAENND